MLLGVLSYFYTGVAPDFHILGLSQHAPVSCPSLHPPLAKDDLDLLCPSAGSRCFLLLATFEGPRGLHSGSYYYGLHINIDKGLMQWNCHMLLASTPILGYRFAG